MDLFERYGSGEASGPGETGRQVGGRQSPAKEVFRTPLS